LESCYNDYFLHIEPQLVEKTGNNMGRLSLGFLRNLIRTGGPCAYKTWDKNKCESEFENYIKDVHTSNDVNGPLLSIKQEEAYDKLMGKIKKRLNRKYIRKRQIPNSNPTDIISSKKRKHNKNPVQSSGRSLRKRKNE
jgi:hypothetical protein